MLKDSVSGSFCYDWYMVKKISKKKYKKLHIILIISSVVLAGIVGVVVSNWTKLTVNDSFYSYDQGEVTIRLKEILNNTPTSDTVVYSDISDIGCDSRNSVGLASYVHCETVAQKYYQSNGDITDGLSRILNEFAANGWTVGGYANQGKFIPDANKLSKQEGNYLIRNDNPVQGEFPQLYVESIGADGKFETYRLKELIKNSKIADPPIGTTIYGYFISITYWNCNENSFFEPRCPIPPSKPF